MLARRILPFAFALFALFVQFVPGGPARAEVRIDSIRGEGRFAQVHFTYRNTTGTTWATVVIECSVPEAIRRTHRGVHYFSNHLSGGIGPGFTGSASARVPLLKGKASEITCREDGTPLTY